MNAGKQLKITKWVVSRRCGAKYRIGSDNDGLALCVISLDTLE